VVAEPEAAAAIDCGTNSTRLLVSAGRVEQVRLMRITRLGQSVDATGKLDPDAVFRTLEVLGEYRELMDAHRVARARLVATSAVRDADNGDEFLTAAQEVTGVQAELLSGEEEGAIAFAGATASLDIPPERAVTIDIGGGSTELVTADPVVRAVSLDLGCVRLTERFLHHDPPTGAELEAAAAFVRSELDGAAGAVPALRRPGLRLVGLAGTISSLGALAQGLAHYDRDRIHHFVLEAPVVEAWGDRLAAESSAERARHPGLAPGREDVIVGGVIVLEETMRRFGFSSCLVSEADLLDGLVATLIQ
jgi:exopolyphosphatase / guanosine-5'-triphosphate,3'-diphosphate pyrophosphatase